MSTKGNITRITACLTCLAWSGGWPAAGQNASPPPKSSAVWSPVAGRLLTSWAKDVNPRQPWPEYPRPQLVRPNWINLNGLWDYALTPQERPRPQEFEGKILVPFPLESALSGVAKPLRKENALWYRRTFSAPDLPAGKRLLLHFGAVDWHATVFVNGREIGQHKGGYDPFTFDITQALRTQGDQELIVRVWDPTDEGFQPKGKQTLHPRGVMYTAVSGIWQTVWLETVPAVYITRVLPEPLPSLDALLVTVHAAGAAQPVDVSVTLKDGDNVVARASGKTGQELRLPIDQPKLWSPDDPFLYELRIRLQDGDAADSYAALRSVTIGEDDRGFNRLCLNGKPLFQYGPLDQGWWPDGLYTAPTDQALRCDVEAIRRLGCNLARKHVKVEPARWYYWCDKLGLLVWQDIPNGGNQGEEGRANFRAETQAIIDDCRFFPSIVMWVLFNEGWGENAYGLDQARQLVAWVRGYDPARLVNSASGFTNLGGDHVNDYHRYPGPGIPPLDPNRAVLLGAFGGLKAAVKDHLWQNQPDARDLGDLAFLHDRYRNLLGKLNLLQGQGLSAAVYTQNTDVENELNGLLTYDRAVNKFAETWLAELHKPLYLDPPAVRLLAGGDEPWRYTTQQPPDAWKSPDFDDSAWPTGPGPFGPGSPSVKTLTSWDSPLIWLRKTFPREGPAEADYLLVWAAGNARFTVELNGDPISTFVGQRNLDFQWVALKPNLCLFGKNLLTVTGERGPAAFEVRLIAARNLRLPPPAD